jgi:hypothetical protein
VAQTVFWSFRLEWRRVHGPRRKGRAPVPILKGCLELFCGSPIAKPLSTHRERETSGTLK